MTTDLTATLADLALRADDQTRIDAVAACARYCGGRASAEDAQAFVDGQIMMLQGMQDSLSSDIRRGWKWLARELEREYPAAPEMDDAEEAFAAEVEPAPAAKKSRRGLRVRFRATSALNTASDN